MPDTLERLAAITPFDRLTEHERAAVFAVMRQRQYAPGEIVLEAGSQPSQLAVCVAGELSDARGTVGPVFDAPALLFGLAVAADCRAGPDGATVLLLARKHLFTLARECPDFIVGLVPDEGEGAA